MENTLNPHDSYFCKHFSYMLGEVVSLGTWWVRHILWLFAADIKSTYRKPWMNWKWLCIPQYCCISYQMRERNKWANKGVIFVGGLQGANHLTSHLHGRLIFMLWVFRVPSNMTNGHTVMSLQRKIKNGGISVFYQRYFETLKFIGTKMMVIKLRSSISSHTRL